MAIPSEARRGFLVVIGAVAALYVGMLILSRLPQ